MKDFEEMGGIFINTNNYMLPRGEILYGLCKYRDTTRTRNQIIYVVSDSLGEVYKIPPIELEPAEFLYLEDGIYAVPTLLYKRIFEPTEHFNFMCHRFKIEDNGEVKSIKVMKNTKQLGGTRDEKIQHDTGES